MVTSSQFDDLVTIRHIKQTEIWNVRIKHIITISLYEVSNRHWLNRSRISTYVYSFILFQAHLHGFYQISSWIHPVLPPSCM